MSDVLVIKSNFNVKPKDLEKIRKNILKQKEEGVVAIPLGFDVVVVVPEDVIVKFKTHYLKEERK